MLIDIYRKERRNIHGKTISDISLVWEKLTEWMTIEQCELLIPFTFGHVRNEPSGYRVWYLSQEPSSKYYHGTWFDVECKVDKRRKLLRCKLNQEAIELFQQYPQIRDNNDC